MPRHVQASGRHALAARAEQAGQLAQVGLAARAEQAGQLAQVGLAARASAVPELGCPS